MIGVLFWIFCGAVVITGFVLIAHTNRRMSVVIKRGQNDDKMAAEFFRELVCDMEQQMIIHDDGDSTPQTLYNNDDVICTIKERLGGNSDLEIMCLFNKRESIKMVELADQLPNFRVYYVPASHQVDGIHYKIIDHGKKAYLSKHCAGSTERQYELVDCSTAPTKVREKMFAKLHEEFGQRITKAEASEAPTATA